MKSKLKITCANFVFIGSALCAAEPDQKIYYKEINNIKYNISLPYKHISKNAGKKFAVLTQGFFTVMHPNSQRDYLVTVFCRPCIGIVIKHKSDPSKNPIIMGHQDVVTAPDNLVNAIKSSGIKEADLQLTFYSDIKKNWSEKNVNVGGDGSIMKSWAELYGTESQKEAFDNCVSFYAKIFPKADINKILNPFDHPTSQLKRHAFIDTTLAIGKDGSIFTFSPLVASICGINDGEGRIDIDRNSTENREDLLTDILQKRFCDAFIAESTNRFLEFNKHKNQMIPFVQVYITQPRK